MTATTSTRPRPDPPGPGARVGSAVAARLRDDPGGTVTAVAALLVVVQLVLRAWIAAQGSFYLDDYVFIARMAHRAPQLTALLTDHAGHVMPGSFLLVWLLTELVPLHWPAAVGVDIALQLGVDIAMLRLLVELFGRRPAVLLPFAVFVTTALTLPATIWWAAAINQLPMQLAVLLACTAHVRYLRSGRVRDVAVATAAVLAGLAFSEKTVLALPLLAALSLLWFVDGRPLARLGRAWWRWQEACVAYGVLGAAYGLYYLLAVPSPFRGGPDVGGLCTLVIGQLVRSVLPGLLGGPWRWQYVPVTLPTTDVPVPAGIAAGLVCAGVVAASLLAHRGAGRAWLLALGYLVVDAALVAASRARVFDPSVFTREYRYLTDFAIVVVLCGALAFLPVRRAPRVLRPRARRWAAVARAAGNRPGWAALAVAGLVAGSVLSGVGYAVGWADNASRDFVATARADLAARPGTTLLVDAPVPDRVMWSLLGPWTHASVLLAAAPEEPAFLVDGQTVDELAMLDDEGHVRRAWVQPAVAAPPGPDPGCGWAVANGPRVVALPTATPAGRWLVRLSYLSAQDNAGWVSAGDQLRAPVLLPAGLHDFFVQVQGPVREVTVELRDPTRPLCVWQVEVGVPRPLPAGFS